MVRNSKKSMAIEILRHLLFLYLSIVCFPLYAELPLLEHDGILRLYAYHLNQWQEIQYEKNGKVDPDGIHQIKQLMKSRDQGDTIDISLELIHSLKDLEGFLYLERFCRGQWVVIGRLWLGNNPIQKFITLSHQLLFDDGKVISTDQTWPVAGPLRLPYGKMRWKVTAKDGTVQNSNEFYLKRQ